MSLSSLYATVIMSAEQHPTASSYIPMIIGLMTNLQNQIAGVTYTATADELAKILLANIKVIVYCLYSAHTEVRLQESYETLFIHYYIMHHFILFEK